MAGRGPNKESGVLGGQLVLDVAFSDRPGGSLADDDRFVDDGTLPIVKIFNPTGTKVADSSVPSNPSPIRTGLGKYEYVRIINNNDELSNKWKIEWSLKLGGTDEIFNETFTIRTGTGQANFGSEEFRKGFAFNNPDLTSNHHYPSWGLLVTPDELRYMVGFGNKLVSPDASQTYDDQMLQWYIDTCLGMIERDLDIDLIPRTVRFRDTIDRITGQSVSRSKNDFVPNIDEELEFFSKLDAEKNARFFIRESGYPYRNLNANHYMYIKLRRRPLREIKATILQDPVSEGSLIDLLPWRRVELGFESKVQFYPDIQTLGGFPYVPTKLFRVNYPFSHFPDAFLIDYDTGFENASTVPIEFRTVLLWTAGILLMEDFSDGKAPGIASASVNLNSVSESISTTQSATNSLLGARIAYYKTHLKDWMKINGRKYRRNLIGIL